MKIGQNKAVALTYELEVDGQIVDRCPEERPTGLGDSRVNEQLTKNSLLTKKQTQ